jgi:hypothetical protein
MMMIDDDNHVYHIGANELGGIDSPIVFSRHAPVGVNPAAFLR